MPPKGKNKNAANHHDKRHEGGLAPPGKRVTKQRSNGHLNVQTNGTGNVVVAAAAAPAPSAIGLSQQGARNTQTAGNNECTSELVERGRTSSDASLAEAESHEMADRPSHRGDHTSGPQTPSIETQRPAYLVSRQSYNGGTLSTVSTILTYYPLRDAISILILLLSLPPTLVLIVQTLFASLTFVPPTAGLSLPTLPNVKEMFSSSGMGYPALATIVIVDLLFWICWLPVWTPLQNMFLDLSQAVIAVSLSGAAASNGRPAYSIATTSLIVCAVHVLRYKAIHLTALDYLRSVIHKSGFGVVGDATSFQAFRSSTSSPSSSYYYHVERGWFYTTLRALLGIHIVSQGVTTYIRRSLVKANEQNANVSNIAKIENEAMAASEQNPKPAGVANDLLSSTNAISDPRLNGLGTTSRENKAREGSGKKKRKQANQVRSQQPLWAAIASTKVTFVKEMEQRDAVDDAREAANMDSNTIAATQPNGSATARIWIREVRDTEISFTVELAPEAAAGKSDRGPDPDKDEAAGVDRSQPFYVCINSAAWSSTRIMPSNRNTDDSNTFNCYDGEIFGLAPLSSYHCTVVGTHDSRILCDTSVITQPSPSTEQTVAASVQQPQTLRPSSPISALKLSIQAAESKLNEARNRGKKSKRDQRGANSDIKREINTLRGKLETSGGTDDKQERRLTQITQHKNQAEEAAAEIKQAIEALGEVPQSELDEFEAQRNSWNSILQAKMTAQQEYDDAKAEADRELNALRLDIEQASSRREKLLARHAQRTQDVQKLVSRQHADTTAKQRRDQERAHILQARENEEQQLRFHISSFEMECQAFQQKAHDAYQQIAALQSWPSQQPHLSSQQQPAPYPGFSAPPTPESQVARLHSNTAAAAGMPTTNAPLSHAANAPPVFGSAQPFTTPGFMSFKQPLINPTSTVPTGVTSRARSSSMLSQYSGFTDNADEIPTAAAAPLIPTAYMDSHMPHVLPHQSAWRTPFNPAAGAGVSGAFPDDRNHSEGSGSLTGGSTGSNSPRPDAKPFIPGTIKAAAKVGLPNDVSSGGSSSSSGGGRAGVGNGKERGEKSRQSPLQTSASVDTR